MLEARSPGTCSSTMRAGLVPGEEIVRHLLGEKKAIRERRVYLLLTGLALLVLATVSCGGAAGEQRAEEPTEEETQAGSGGEQATVDLEHPSMGDENAPVVLTEYADYQ